VGSQKCGLDRDRMKPSQSACRPEHPELGFRLQAVSRFDLQGRDPFGQKGEKTGRRSPDQVILRGPPSRPHGIAYSASLASDLLVTFPLQPGLELPGTVSPEDQMGMAVHQPRRHPHALQLQDLPSKIRRPPREVPFPTHPGDSPALRRQGAIRDLPVAVGPRGHCGQVAADPEPIPRWSQVHQRLYRPSSKGIFKPWARAVSQAFA
jgi:hypothetical protein